MSVYPTGTDSFTTKVDNVDDVMAADVNSLQSSVVAIQNTLGTSSSYNFMEVPINLTGINILSSITGGQPQTVLVHNNIAYLGGNFTAVNGVARTGLAAIDLSDYSVVTSFNPSLTPMAWGSTVVNSIGLRDNNSIFIAGAFDYSGLTYCASGLAAVNIADGSLNETFAPVYAAGGFGVSQFSTVETGTSDVLVGGSFDGNSSAIKSYDKTTGSDGGVFKPDTSYLRSNIFNDVFVAYNSNATRVFSITDGSLVQTLTSSNIQGARGSGSSVIFYGPYIGLDQVSPVPPSRAGIAVYGDINDLANSIDVNAYFHFSAAQAPVSNGYPNINRVVTYKEYLIYDNAYALFFVRKSDFKVIAVAQTPSGYPYYFQVDGDWLYTVFTTTSQIGSTLVKTFAKIDLSVLP